MSEAEQPVVAIVDDDDAVRDSLRCLLEVVGLTVQTFASASEFLAAELGHVGCLILDQHMPGITGLELVEHLQTNGSQIPIWSPGPHCRP